MEKIAVIELETNNVKMQLVNVVKNKYYVVYNEVSMPINLTKDFYEDKIIKPSAVKELNDILKVFKLMLDNEQIVETICYASCMLNEAKNLNGFLNELTNASTFKFNVLMPEEEISNIYTAVINTFNKPKGLIINISNYSTQFMLYNRRNILNTYCLPYGSINMLEKYSEIEDPIVRAEKIESEVSDMVKDLDWVFELPEDFEVVCTGAMFRNLGVVSRRAKKYPLDIEHNYQMSYQDFEKVYNVVKPLESNATSKLKGISINDSQYFPTALAMMNGILSKMKDYSINICATDKQDGMLLNYAIPLTMEKPITDILGYSLQILNEYYDREQEKSLKIYELAMILFKQLKVLHKLGRNYIKVLRIASYLTSCGDRVRFKDREKSAFSIIQNSDIYGVSHNEIILACFVSLLRNPDNFNLADWVKYKDLVSDVDLAAVKKLACILKVAESLNVTGFGRVQDISCDILGHSVIMKTIVESDVSLEIKYTMLVGPEFKKAFNKNLEII